MSGNIQFYSLVIWTIQTDCCRIFYDSSLSLNEDLAEKKNRKLLAHEFTHSYGCESKTKARWKSFALSQLQKILCFDLIPPFMRVLLNYLSRSETVRVYGWYAVVVALCCTTTCHNVSLKSVSNSFHSWFHNALTTSSLCCMLFIMTSFCHRWS